MKIYVDIILSGKKFNPLQISEMYNIQFKKAKKKGDYNSSLNCKEYEGYGILTSDGRGYSESVIDIVLSDYEKLYNIGEEKLGIEYKEFNLYIEMLAEFFYNRNEKTCKNKQFFSYDKHNLYTRRMII